jgi:hypothetical protein
MIDPISITCSSLVFKDDAGYWRSKFKTGEVSHVGFHKILYDDKVSLQERVYYIRLASIIPPYLEPWIPKAFVTEENAVNLIKQHYLEPYLDGYRLPKEEENL